MKIKYIACETWGPLDLRHITEAFNTIHEARQASSILEAPIGWDDDIGEDIDIGSWVAAQAGLVICREKSKEATLLAHREVSLDEASSGVGPVYVGSVVEVVKRFNDAGKCVIAILECECE